MRWRQFQENIAHEHEARGRSRPQIGSGLRLVERPQELAFVLHRMDEIAYCLGQIFAGRGADVPGVYWKRLPVARLHRRALLAGVYPGVAIFLPVEAGLEAPLVLVWPAAILIGGVR